LRIDGNFGFLALFGGDDGPVLVNVIRDYVAFYPVLTRGDNGITFEEDLTFDVVEEGLFAGGRPVLFDDPDVALCVCLFRSRSYRCS